MCAQNFLLHADRWVPCVKCPLDHLAFVIWQRCYVLYLMICHRNQLVQQGLSAECLHASTYVQTKLVQDLKSRAQHKKFWCLIFESFEYDL